MFELGELVFHVAFYAAVWTGELVLHVATFTKRKPRWELDNWDLRGAVSFLAGATALSALGYLVVQIA